MIDVTVSMIDQINRKAYNDPELVGIYASWDWLQPAERAILREIEYDIRGRPLLDIGVGGGRTSAPLIQLSSDYIGIDYSKAMIEAAKRRYPEANLRWCDARDLSMFADGHFDFVFFSFNGLDSAPDADRRIILREIFRVLRKGGYFAFSSHNRNSPAFARYLSPFAGFRRWPAKPMTRRPPLGLPLASKLRDFGAHLRKRKHQVIAKDYAIINEPAAGYAYLLYYTTIKNSISQLRDCGASGPVRVFDDSGHVCGPECRSSWIHYLVTK